ncbi:MAG: caspase family protein [Leptospiraceae bacterium]|nr:caspase family protein [Leptospiraceae bacterium]MBK9501852.1 caspase family protein [Leptospiraceae bacterium]
MLLSFSSDGSLRYWDMDTGKLLLTQLLFKEGESIYYTADGYFDFTDKKVMDYIAYTSPSIQSGFIDLQDLWEDYKRDDLKESVLAGRFKPKKGSNLIRSVETTPVIKTLFDPQKTISPDKDNYPMRIQVSEKGSRLGSVVVFVNGVQVVNTKLSEESTEKDMEIKEEETLDGKSFQLKFPVPLNYGTNRVEIKAYNEFGIPQSYPAFDLERRTPANLVLPKPNLYVLSVGVNEYQKNKLKFSVKDAEAMAEVLSKNGKELYSAIHVKKLLDKDATKKGIEDALADIARNAKPEDVVLIYLSGHGNNASSREVKSLFYFVPFDFNWSSDSQAEYVAREQGIDAEYLNETFTKIKSHKVILILDACHSGSIQTAMLAKGEDETKASRKAMDRMANGTGRFIFASSAGNELSREHSEAGHGLYTYVLLNALGKNTDKKIPNADYINADGFIYLSEIRSYIEQKFEDQTEKYLTGVRQSPPSMSLGRTGMHERVNDFPLLKVK